ncbi:double-stranded RNA-binding protein 3, partial [Striga asiatica]
MYKSKLQELCQRSGWELPTYKTVGDGPGHMPCFRAAVAGRSREFSRSQVIKPKLMMDINWSAEGMPCNSQVCNHRVSAKPSFHLSTVKPQFPLKQTSPPLEQHREKCTNQSCRNSARDRAGSCPHTKPSEMAPGLPKLMMDINWSAEGVPCNSQVCNHHVSVKPSFHLSTVKPQFPLKQTSPPLEQHREKCINQSCRNSARDRAGSCPHTKPSEMAPGLPKLMMDINWSAEGVPCNSQVCNHRVSTKPSFHLSTVKPQFPLKQTSPPLEQHREKCTNQSCRNSARDRAGSCPHTKPSEMAPSNPNFPSNKRHPHWNNIEKNVQIKVAGTLPEIGLGVAHIQNRRRWPRLGNEGLPKLMMDINWSAEGVPCNSQVRNHRVSAKPSFHLSTVKPQFPLKQTSPPLEQHREKCTNQSCRNSARDRAGSCPHTKPSEMAPSNPNFPSNKRHPHWNNIEKNVQIKVAGTLPEIGLGPKLMMDINWSAEGVPCNSQVCNHRVSAKPSFHLSTVKPQFPLKQTSPPLEQHREKCTNQSCRNSARDRAGSCPHKKPSEMAPGLPKLMMDINWSAEGVPCNSQVCNHRVSAKPSFHLSTVKPQFPLKQTSPPLEQHREKCTNQSCRNSARDRAGSCPHTKPSEMAPSNPNFPSNKRHPHWNNIEKNVQIKVAGTLPEIGLGPKLMMDINWSAEGVPCNSQVCNPRLSAKPSFHLSTVKPQFPLKQTSPPLEQHREKCTNQSCRNSARDRAGSCPHTKPSEMAP